MLNRFSLVVFLNLTFLCAVQSEDLVKETFESAAAGEELAGSVDATNTWTARGRRQSLAVTTDAAGLNSGNVLNIKNVLFYTSFPNVKLEAGDSLHLTCRFRYRGERQEGGFPFRAGLYFASSGEPSDGNSPGYWYLSNPSSDNGNAMIAVEEGSDSALGGGDDIKAIEQVVPASHSGTQAFPFGMTISRAADGINIECKEGASEPLLRVDAESKITEFNALAFSIIGAEGDVVMDDVVLTVKRAGK